jgi:YHS domain-containing protein
MMNRQRDTQQAAPNDPTHPMINDQMVIDPVCGMVVNPATAAGSHEHKGRQYYFCSRSCLERFRNNPPEFLTRSPDEASPGRVLRQAAAPVPASGVE